ncbi:MAG: hypothetical protein WC580_02585 [Agrococcus sp.]
MSDGTEQSGTERINTGEVTVPESARVLLPDDAIKDRAGNLGAAEWPAGEADEPHGQAAVEESQPDAGTAVAGTPSAEDERLRAERANDDGELTPSDPSQPIDQATPPANLAEPLR